MARRNTRIVFMGSPHFAVPSLRALVEQDYDVALVVTQADRPAGRGGELRPPPVKIAAEYRGIETFQPESLRDEAVQARLAAAGADVFVVAAYGRILPREVLALPRRGCLNVHASLLPRWRGASPIAAAILAGDSRTGVSIMELVPKMDAGPVVASTAAPIGPGDSTASLEPRLARLGAELLVQTLWGWMEGLLVAQPQDEAGVTTCSLLRKQDGHLRAAMSADEAERAVRAYDPWPGAYVMFRDQRLAIWAAHVEDLPPAPPGTLSVARKLPAIAFTDAWLVLDEVQRSGSSVMSGQAFLAGQHGKLPPSVGLA